MTLAKKLTALPGFRWEVGMLVQQASGFAMRCTSAPTGDESAWGYNGESFGQPIGQEGDVPDLADNATGGVLLGWLAAMGMQPTADCDASSWDVGAGKPTEWRWSGNAPTLGEACAAALIALGRCE